MSEDNIGFVGYTVAITTIVITTLINIMWFLFPFVAVYMLWSTFK